MAVFELHVQLNILALVNICSATALVNLGAGRRIEGNALQIQEVNLMLLEGQIKLKNSLCFSRDSKSRPSEYMSGHL